MEQTEEKKTFCTNCEKEKDGESCVEMNGKKFCCEDCAPDEAGENKPKKPAICEFC